METSKKNKSDDEMLLKESFLVLIVLENGSYSWVISKEFSEKQKLALRKVNTVLDSPSYVLSFVLHIESLLKVISAYFKRKLS